MFNQPILENRKELKRSTSRIMSKALLLERNLPILAFLTTFQTKQTLNHQRSKSLILQAQTPSRKIWQLLSNQWLGFQIDSLNKTFSISLITSQTFKTNLKWSRSQRLFIILPTWSKITIQISSKTRLNRVRILLLDSLILSEREFEILRTQPLYSLSWSNP